jgi:uncharacterized protein (DUF2249 family)
METVEIDLTIVPMIRRLDTILAAWKKLPNGHALRITNDKEPKPLQFLFRSTKAGRHEWTCEQQGTDTWVALIRKIRTPSRRDRGSAAAAAPTTAPASG